MIRTPGMLMAGAAPKNINTIADYEEFRKVRDDIV